MSTTNVLRGAVVVLMAVATARCISCFDALPARMMTHFDVAGRPDGFMPRGAFFVVYGLLTTGTVLTVLLISKLPLELVNVPNRAYWLEPEHRAALHAKLVSISTWLALGLTLLFVWLLEQVIEANLRQRALDGTQLQLTLSLLALGVLAQFIWARRSFRVPSTS